MKKKPISRESYIHRNKNNITIGIKGKPKQVFSLKLLNNQITQIQTQAQELYQKYKHNTKFPLKLGSTGEPVPFISGAYSNILTVNEGFQAVLNPEEFAAELKELGKISQSYALFEKKYYREVNKYYGTRYGLEKTKELLKKRGFKVLRSEVRWGYKNKNVISDAVRLQDWIIKNIDGASAWQITNITNVDELNLIIQRWEITGDIPQKLKVVPGESNDWYTKGCKERPKHRMGE